MHAKSLFLTLNLLLMALSAGALHAAEANQAEQGKPFDCPAPVLPIAAVRDNLSGNVTLQYQSDAQGRFADIRIIKSSGFQPLDKAAVISLSRCRLPVPMTAGLPPPGTMEFKFGRQVRVENSSAPELIADSCDASGMFSTYTAATGDRVEALGISIRFGVTEDGMAVTPASYEQDVVMAAEAVKFIQTCRFKPAMQNGSAVRSSSNGFIRLRGVPAV